MSVFLYLLHVLILIVNQSDAARILAVFPVPSISHQVVFRPLTEELASRGHDVIVITPNPAFPKEKTPAHLTEIDVHNVSYNIWMEEFMTKGKAVAADPVPQIELILNTFALIVGKQLETEAVQKILKDKNQKFDLLLVEACVRPALVYSHIFKAPVILVSSFGAVPGNYELLGAPNNPILYPSVLLRKAHNLTMWEKIINLYQHYSMIKLYEKTSVIENKIIRENIGPDVPSVDELGNNVHMLFLNIHPLLEGIRPVPPGVVYLGGLHQSPNTELPQDLKSYLDSSKNGVIYFSLGTNVDPSQLPPEIIQIIVKAFSQLPYNVIMKWSGEELPGKTENVMISKWLPQSDLLNHPNVKLFITQGGLQSTDEAITSAVPLVGIPMLGDQWYNVEKYVYHKIGVKLDIGTLTEEDFLNAIKTVIEDESYKQNIIKLRDVMHDQPETPLERAVWWTEHVLRHGGGAKHLRSPAANITWSEYLELELVFTLIAGLSVLVLVLIVIVISLCKYFIKSGKVKTN